MSVMLTMGLWRLVGLLFMVGIMLPVSAMGPVGAVSAVCVLLMPLLVSMHLVLLSILTFCGEIRHGQQKIARFVAAAALKTLSRLYMTL
eukprot:CAMPEP_0115256606 /NCGR_PEP_ID=MMETSP0270-20121206/46337_1 /TAXON_ID=71861 /ORGANISM="Scrippsiella trochoidea, Strain CCMP3099" /LENGTH=88 /DNA_ID=CAMNT_0002672273 /DNA_START=997 /DNA_END=1263 /DNA_ORIENTATION=-